MCHVDKLNPGNSLYTQICWKPMPNCIQMTLTLDVEMGVKLGKSPHHLFSTFRRFFLFTRTSFWFTKICHVLYVKNHWTKHWLGCTHSFSFIFFTIVNSFLILAKIFTNSDIFARKNEGIVPFDCRVRVKRIRCSVACIQVRNRNSSQDALHSNVPV